MSDGTGRRYFAKIAMRARDDYLVFTARYFLRSSRFFKMGEVI
ncbi:MAG: hypothetical protein WCA08_11840 [Desulfoferrobacter sp.]